MYRIKRAHRTSISCNNSYQAERIEQKIERIVSNKEPIKDGAPLIYTERKDGVNPAYDIRTDRWEIATEAMDKVAAAKLAKREAKVVPMDTSKTDTKTENNNSGTEAKTNDTSSGTEANTSD